MFNNFLQRTAKTLASVTAACNWH